MDALKCPRGVRQIAAWARVDLPGENALSIRAESEQAV
jgi:hypothetical protein